MSGPCRCATALVAGALALATPSAAAGDGDLREDLADLIALASEGVREGHEGPSPTALARRVLERKEKEVRDLLEDAWKRAGVPRSPASEQQAGIHHVARYLWSLDRPPAPADPSAISFGGVTGSVHEVAGIVVVRPGGTGERGRVLGEKGWDRDGEDPRKSFAAIVKGGKWRKPPRPDARAMFKALDDGAPEKWTESEKISFHLGLGEACGADAGTRPQLLKRFEEAPGDPLLAAAVGRTGAPEAVAALRSRIRPLAARVAEGKEAALPLLAAACKGLHRADPAAFFDEAGKLDPAGEQAAFQAVGFRAVCAALLDRHGKAADPAEKRRALLRTVDLVLRAHFFREFPSGADMPRLVGAWTEALDSGDAELAQWVDRGAYGLFFVGFRDGPAGIHFSSNEVSVQGSGERCGPYPDMKTLLRRLDEDLRAGRLAFSDRVPRAFDPVPGAVPDAESGEDRAWSGVPCPIPTWAEAGTTSPLRLSSEKAGAGLRLTLTNAGKTPFAIDPAVLRYGTAEHVPVTVKGVPGGPKSFTYLRVSFGDLGGWERWRVPAKEVVVLAPGGAHSWELLLRPDHAAVDHISIEWHDRFQVEDDVQAPLLRSLGWSWVR